MNSKLRQAGAMDILLIPFIMLLVIFLGVSAFAGWSYMGRQDYKKNVDTKIVAAVKVAQTQTKAAKDSEFAEKEKLPLKDYLGPAAFGSVIIKYPKTWSAYVDEKTTTGGTPVEAYFHPNFVPGLNANKSFALRAQVLSTSYNQVVRQYESQIKNGKIAATAYAAPKVASVPGIRLDGAITPRNTGAMVILPMRDKTLKVWTESGDFTKDFNENILPNFSFEP